MLGTIIAGIIGYTGYKIWDEIDSNNAPLYKMDNVKWAEDMASGKYSKLEMERRTRRGMYNSPIKIGGISKEIEARNQREKEERIKSEIEEKKRENEKIREEKRNLQIKKISRGDKDLVYRDEAAYVYFDRETESKICNCVICIKGKFIFDDEDKLKHFNKKDAIQYVKDLSKEEKLDKSRYYKIR